MTPAKKAAAALRSADLLTHLEAQLAKAGDRP